MKGPARNGFVVISGRMALVAGLVQTEKATVVEEANASPQKKEIDGIAQGLIIWVENAGRGPIRTAHVVCNSQNAVRI